MGESGDWFDDGIERLLAVAEDYVDLVKATAVFAIATACLGASIGWSAAGGDALVSVLLLAAYWLLAAVMWHIATRRDRVPISMERLDRWKAWAAIIGAVVTPAITLAGILLTR